MKTTFRDLPVGTTFKVLETTAPSAEELLRTHGWSADAVASLELPWCPKFYRASRKGAYTFLPFGVESGVVLRKVSQTSVKFPGRDCHWVVGSFSYPKNDYSKESVVWYDLKDHMVVEVVTALK